MEKIWILYNTRRRSQSSEQHVPPTAGLNSRPSHTINIIKASAAKAIYVISCSLACIKAIIKRRGRCGKFPGFLNYSSGTIKETENPIAYWLRGYSRGNPILITVVMMCMWIQKVHLSIAHERISFSFMQFPLLSKSNRLRKLVLEESGESAGQIHLYNFPGGSKAFEICAKFCYGITVILNALNVVMARCAAEYLEMTEDTEKGNLISKIEIFLSSSILRGWKDSIIVLQTTKSLLPWSENLKIVGRCIDSIVSKISVDHCSVKWSYTYNKKLAVPDEIVEQGVRSQQMLSAVPRDWWVEDICGLDIDHFKKVMLAVEDKGLMPEDIIVEALKAYAVTWFPNSIDSLVSDEYIRKNRSLVETIICLVPCNRGSRYSCSFLFKLLKIVLLIEAEDKVKEEVVSRISMQLDKASVKDLLIPSKSSFDTIYDVQLVLTLVNRFMEQYGSIMDSDFLVKDEEIADHFALVNASLLTIGKLVDEYLAEISSDPNLPLTSFIECAKSIPEVARSNHDGLYTAIDVYLKEHSSLSKAEKKRICGLMDVKKLSRDASAHAAQNDRLPLRVIVQVLFFEQVRSAAEGLAVPSLQGAAQIALKVDEGSDTPASEHCKPITKQLKDLQISKDECANTGEKKTSKNSENRGNGLLLPSRSRRIFDKLWVGKVQIDNNRSSVTSGTGSSQSPSKIIESRGT
ncbi:hypothetical protein Taro_028056 [Colocasia esculenta]|uniref:NPH3 domain-containing protein n=1 Tax=Colocasia esculenta TaxID=4460 RepID=A0A843VHG1_COLES|nr:hypothetical protein [Colocasia esculenta]